MATDGAHRCDVEIFIFTGDTENVWLAEALLVEVSIFLLFDFE